jgi:hypothetical protein
VIHPQVKPELVLGFREGTAIQEVKIACMLLPLNTFHYLRHGGGGSDSGSPELCRTRLMSMLVSLLINILKEYIKINLFFKKYIKLYKVIALSVKCT